MPNSENAFELALEALESGRTPAAIQALANLETSPEDPFSTALAATRALAHAQQGMWTDVLGVTEPLVASARGSAEGPGTPLRPEDGPLVPGLRAVALARQEPSEEALRTALTAVFLPRDPLPLLARPGLRRLQHYFRRTGARLVADAALAEAAPGGTETDAAEPEDYTEDPFLGAVLALLWPDPVAARTRLHRAVQAGLDLPALHLALARLARRAGDLQEAAQRLEDLPAGALDDALRPWRDRELRMVRGLLPPPPEGERLEAVVVRRPDARLRLRWEHRLYLIAEQLGDAGVSSDGSPSPQAAEPGATPQVQRRWVAQPPDPEASLGTLIEDAADAGFDPDSASVRWRGVPPPLTALAGGSGRQPGSAAAVQLDLGKALLGDFPDDAPLLAQVLDLSHYVRGAAPSLPLAERYLALFGETAEALERLARLLYEGGWTQESLGTLFHLEHTHGAGALSPEAWALLVEAHVLPHLAVGAAQDLLAHAERLHPDAPQVAEARARLAFWQGRHDEALDSLVPLLAAPQVPLRRAVLALQIHLDGDIPGVEALLRAATDRFGREPLVQAARHELEGHAGAALSAYRAAAAAAPAAAALEIELYAMRAACRLSQFEDGLRIARGLQTRIGTPDPRCLDAIHECLTALEPGEARDDLAEMSEEAWRRAAQAGVTTEVRRRAILAAGWYLDPDLLAPLWSAEGLPAPPDAGELPAADPRLADAVIVCATGTGAAVLCDPVAFAAQHAPESGSWLDAPEVLSSLLDRGALALAPSPAPSGPIWLGVTTAPLSDSVAECYEEVRRGTLTVPSGQLYLGPAEALLLSPEAEEDAASLAQELGGRTRLVPPGRYGFRLYLRSGIPWPEDPSAPDPCDVVFRLEPPAS